MNVPISVVTPIDAGEDACVDRERDAVPHRPGSERRTVADHRQQVVRTPTHPASIAGLMALQRHAGNRAVSRLVGTGPGQPRQLPTLLVDAGATPTAGQQPLAVFLDQVSAEVTRAVADALRGTRYSAEDCPQIPHWIAYFRNRPAAHVEEVLRRYTNTREPLSTAAEYLPRIVQRVGKGIRAWLAGRPAPTPADYGIQDGGPPAPDRGVAPPVLPFVDDPSVAAQRHERTLGPGSPLDAGTREPMERVFGTSFADVEAHTSGPGSRLAADLGARAVTVGNRMAFAPGEYAPDTVLGDALIAHELAHVLQQRGGDARTDALASGRADDAAAVEHDADRSATAAIVALWGRAGGVAAELARNALPRLRSGIRLRRCSNPSPPVDHRPRYREIVAELRPLYARKRAVLEGAEPGSTLAVINARISTLVAELQRMGVQLGPDQIYQALEGGGAPRDLLRVSGNIVQQPGGPSFWGQRRQYALSLDYVPEGREIQTEWRWSSRGREAAFLDAGLRSRHLSLTLTEAFWNTAGSGSLELRRNREITVLVRVYLGNETTPQDTIWAEPTRFAAEAPDALAITTEPSVALIDDPVEFGIADWVPVHERYTIDWAVDGTTVARDQPRLRRPFSAVGQHSVTATLYEAHRDFGLTRGPLLRTAVTSVTVQSQQTAAEALLAQTKPGALPQLGGLEASIVSSIAELERRVAAGGEQQAFWRDRLEAQRDRLARLREHASGSGQDQPLPTDLSTCRPGTTYSAPIPAAIVLPSAGGAQPLSIHLRLVHDGAQWTARFLDTTGRDVYKFDGIGATPLAATHSAADAWHADHPYPRGGRVAFQFAPPGWGGPNGFETTTAWNTAKAWVDGVLTVGGIVVAGLLLLSPDPTGATKWLGYVILAASVARSSVAIYENVRIGIPATDSRNVLEGLSILTSMLGVGGTALRQLGINTVAPTMYRAGSWMVMSTLAGDAGTLVFATVQGIEQIRVAQSDPGLDDGQRAAQTLRVVAQLLNSGAMFYISNRDLMRQGIRRSDFFRTTPAEVSAGARPAAGARASHVELETGARLDIAAELRAAGEPSLAARMRSGAVGDRELVDRHGALPWLRSGLDASGVEHMLLHVETGALVAMQDIPSPRARAAFDGVGNGDAANRLAPELRGAGLESFATERVATGSVVDVATEPGLVRINGIAGRAGSGLEISPSRLAELTKNNTAVIHDLMETTRALANAGGDPARMPPQLRARLDQFVANRGGRLYFEHLRQRGLSFLTGDLQVPASRFPNPSRRDLDRLYQLRNENTPAPMREWARDYAMSRNPANAAEFVEHFQYFVGEFTSRRDELIRRWGAARDAEVAAYPTRHGQAPSPVALEEINVNAVWATFPPGERPAVMPMRRTRMNETQVRRFLQNAVAERWTTPGTGGGAPRLSAAGAAEVGAAYQARVATVAGRVGAVPVGTDLLLNELPAAIRDVAGRIGFPSESSAAYHVLKHFRELTPSERARASQSRGSEARSYLESLDQTLRTGTVRTETSQYGERRLFFERTDEGTSLRAIVVVTQDGRAMVVTYGGGE
jgi:hypothetical protein